ncbi:MAG TPA: PH domain-containing protein [Pedococcus sp.]|jgi:hypothetical protein|uniref:PH domain-containing protein n=1 Tax=Pedococcus sp. TaxID=2860345 RepID=UPI002F925BBC
MAPVSSGSHRELDRYLLDGERLVTAVHQHWAKVAEPVASAVAGGALALWVDATIDPALGLVSTVLWWAWFVVLGRAAYLLAEWRHDWFVATDKRLLLFYGFITRRVSMMPLSKVTDMSYSRSVPGRALGYGRFIMESAGQDQALREVNFVPQPDHHYRAICAEIFRVFDRDRRDRTDRDRTDRGPVGDDRAELPGPYSGWDDPRYAGDSSTAIPVRPPTGGHESGGSLYRSPDLERGDRDADTGPITYLPPRDDRGDRGDRRR